MSDTAMLGPGDPVEVFVRYNRSWVGGFEILTTSGSGYQLRRTSDRSLLPSITSPGDLRLQT